MSEKRPQRDPGEPQDRERLEDMEPDEEVKDLTVKEDDTDNVAAASSAAEWSEPVRR